MGLRCLDPAVAGAGGGGDGGVKCTGVGQCAALAQGQEDPMNIGDVAGPPKFARIPPCHPETDR